MNSKHLYVLLHKPACKKQVDRMVSSDLFCAAKIPLAELVQTEPAEIAQFLYTDSYTPAWARRHRRPIEPGDGFWLDGTTYLFAVIKDGQTLAMTVTNKINIKEVLSK